MKGRLSSRLCVQTLNNFVVDLVKYFPLILSKNFPPKQLPEGGRGLRHSGMYGTTQNCHLFVKGHKVFKTLFTNVSIYYWKWNFSMSPSVRRLDGWSVGLMPRSRKTCFKLWAMKLVKSYHLGRDLNKKLPVLPGQGLCTFAKILQLPYKKKTNPREIPTPPPLLSPQFHPLFRRYDLM